MLRALRTNLAPDIELYAHGAALSRPKMRALPSFDANLARYDELQSKIDQSCKYESHESKQLIGRDCYDLMPYKDNNIRNKKGGKRRVLVEKPEAAGSARRGGGSVARGGDGGGGLVDAPLEQQREAATRLAARGNGAASATARRP